MNKPLITLVAAGLMPLVALADGTVTGSVVNKANGQPIDFANVQLILASTKKATSYGTQTDLDGNFTLPNVKDGKYIVRITNLGSVSQDCPVTVAGGKVSIGKIQLAEDTKMLDEIVVTGVKSQMHFELDRKVFNVDSNIASAGASASELLESIPSVEVDQDGEVSLRGNSSVTVWINGKESGLTADNRAQILEQIPAETIDRIEVITNPSAKYDPEGTAGIINIVLKKDRTKGYFGSAEIGANTRGAGNVNFNINYNSGKWETYAGIGFRMRHNKGGSSSRRDYDNGDFLYSDGVSKNHGNNIFLRLGATYHLTAKDDFYVNAFGMLGHRYNHSEVDYTSNLPGSWIANTNYNRERGDMRGTHIEWGYKHTWNDHHSIDMNVGYNHWGGPSQNSYTQNQTFADGSVTDIYQYQEQNIGSNNWEAKIDYTNQLTEWLKLEAGYAGNYNHENTPVTTWSGTSPEDKVYDPNLYNRFIYNNNISALYLTLGGKYKSFSFNAGLRGETWQVRSQSLADGQSRDEVEVYKKNFFALFPSVFLSWSLPYDNEVQINYTRRLRRPWGGQLNSFVNISDPTNYSMGNPELEPEYTNAFELNYIKSWQDHMISASAYVRLSDNMISRVSFLSPAADSESDIMYSTFANVGKQTNSGCEIVVKNNLFNRVLDLTTTFNLYNNHVSAWSLMFPLNGTLNPISGESQNQFAWDVRCMASLKLPWGLSFQATGRYNSRTLTAQGSREPGWDVQAGLRKNVGAWSFSINARDIFNSRKMHNFTYGNGYSQETKRWRGSQSVRFTVKYSFGNMSAKKMPNTGDEPMDGSGYGDTGQ